MSAPALPAAVVRALEAPVTSFRHGTGFAIAGSRFAVAADRPEPVTDIAAYIPPAPSFPLLGDEGLDEVVLLYDAAAAAALRARVGAGQEVPVKPDISYLRADLPEQAVVYASARGDTDARHLVVRRDRRFLVVAEDVAPAVHRTPLRIVREIALRRLENAGGCFAHCAVAAGPGLPGALIVGDASAGKSSTGWELVRTGAGRFVANDRAILRQDGEALIACAWPIGVRLGMGTVHATVGLDQLKRLPLLRPQSAAIWTQSFTDIGEAAANFGSRDKLELSPSELAELTGSAVDDAIAVGLLLLPELSLQGGPLRLEPAPVDRARAILDRNVREPVDPEYFRGWLGVRQISDAALEEAKRRVIDAALALPRFRVTGDPRQLGKLRPLLGEVLDRAGEGRW